MIEDILEDLELIKKKIMKLRGYDKEIQKSEIITKYFSISIDGYTVIMHKNNNIINLTPLEFDLLYFLSMRKNKLCKNADIYDYIFNDNTDLINNATLVSVHIFRIRKKIGYHCIKTKRGFGYMVE